MLLAIVAAWALFAASSVQARTVTVAPNTPTGGNCYPFGIASPGTWTPFAGFVYKNVPAFELKTGDTLAFDLVQMNDVNIQLDIALARTTTNGGTVEAQPFQTVVTNTQTPANPRGDTIQGNFELQFTAQAPFSFPGGGLIIRFSNPSASYQLDSTCEGVLKGGTASDTSGFFVERFYQDADGVSPWSVHDTGNIGAFQVKTKPAITSIKPAAGPRAGGTSVTIKGQDFTGATAVSFGSVPAKSFTVNSDGQITAVSPAESGGTVDVHVTNANGQSLTVPADKYTFGCVVPNLKGKKLKAAKKALKKADCRLGKVKKGKAKKKGRVKRQKPKPGTVLPAGSKVKIKLG